MGLSTDLAKATADKANLLTDGALPSIISDAGTFLTNLQAQVTALTGDLSDWQALLASVTTNGGSPLVLASCSKVITDLQAQTA
jgi:hypothetical protein